MISTEDFAIMREQVMLAIRRNIHVDEMIMRNTVDSGTSSSGSSSSSSGTDKCFSMDAMRNLYEQTLTQYWKVCYSQLLDMKDTLVQQVNSGNKPLFAISQELKFSSYRVAKFYVNAILPPSITIAQILEDPNIIPNETVRRDIMKCVSHDPLYSHEHAQQQECLGREYEELLYSNLSRLHLCYETENELRARGKPKTPDALFLIPMYVTLEHYPGHKQTFVVNWIDSKAMFATAETFAEHLEQFKGYTNRYGRGLVIYWYGFVENVLSVAANSIGGGGVDDDAGVLVTDKFPTVWTYPTGKVASAESNAFTDEAER
jgi:hypothetical protein